VHGLDSPSLRELAGLSQRDDPRLAGEVFPTVVEELGDKVPTAEQAAWLFVSDAADEMITGGSDADTLFEIVWTHTPLSSDETIRAFITAYATWNQQDDPEEKQHAQWEMEQVAWVLRANGRRLSK
jgi:hypothetical protein